MIFFAVIRSEVILHIFKPLPLEEYINLIFFYLHDVWTFAKDKEYTIAQL